MKVHRVCHILCAVKTKLIGFQDILVFLALKWFIYWMINFRNNSHFQPNIKNIYLSFCIWDRCTYITTKVVSSNLVHVLDTTLCDKVCQWLATGRLFSSGTQVSFTNKTDRHVITELLLNVALNTINPNQSDVHNTKIPKAKGKR